MTTTIAPTTPRQAPVTITVRNGHMVAAINLRLLSADEVQIAHEEIVRALARFEGKGRCFVLDLSTVAALSSLGVGMCVDTRHRAIERGMRPILFGLQPPLLHLLRVLKVDRLSTIVHGESELGRMLDA